MASKVLVVEDDLKVRTLIAWRLEADGHDVVAVADGGDALGTVGAEAPDLMVLDLSLPGVAGLDVLRRVRETAAGLPVIIVSARTGETERIVGLDLGADDYLVKPFSPDELAARVRSLLRRTGLATPPGERIDCGALVIDLAVREVRLDGRAVPLTPKEFDLLAALSRSPRRVFSRAQLLHDVWRSSGDWQDEATVTQHVHRLRHKLERDPARPEWVLTVPRAGYRFEPSGGRV